MKSDMKALLSIGRHCQINAIRISEDTIVMEMTGPNLGDADPFTVKLTGIVNAD